jgi:hypothetical protein
MRSRTPRSLHCGTWIESITTTLERPVKKGRHRRFEEARALKRTSEPTYEDIVERASEKPCPECGADPGHDHASWCLADETPVVEEPWA